jgi:hypothetical protein
MKGVQIVAKDAASEDKIYARLRELTDATRQVRKDLEAMIRHSREDRARALASDYPGPKRGSNALPPRAGEPRGKDRRDDDSPRNE